MRGKKVKRLRKELIQYFMNPTKADWRRFKKENSHNSK